MTTDVLQQNVRPDLRDIILNGLWAVFVPVMIAALALSGLEWSTARGLLSFGALIGVFAIIAWHLLVTHPYNKYLEKALIREKTACKERDELKQLLQEQESQNAVAKLLMEQIIENLWGSKQTVKGSGTLVAKAKRWRYDLAEFVIDHSDPLDPWYVRLTRPNGSPIADVLNDDYIETEDGYKRKSQGQELAEADTEIGPVPPPVRTASKELPHGAHVG
ncbi:MAG: hypothetical protein ABIH21_05700 [Patescibacteria group bacterium]